MKIVCTGWILFSFITNSLELLPLFCKTNCCFSVFFFCFTATTALYPFLCSFIRSWLIVSLTIFPTQRLGYWLRSHISSSLVNASWTAPNCWWLGTGGVLFPVLCFSCVQRVNSYDSSKLFQYLMVVDTMCKKFQVSWKFSVWLMFLIGLQHLQKFLHVH